MNSYANKLLIVDLTSGKITAELLNEKYVAQYIGGAGLAARYLYDRIDAQTDPLGPDNPLIFMTGPLDATSAPSSGRFVVVARSPQTGIYGEANAGNFFGPDLKFAGYDGIIVRGKSSAPVYLYIRDDLVELRDATHLRGKTTFETGDAIRAESNDPKLTIAAIGPAGENLVKYAIILASNPRPGAKKGIAGRCGMGAVMGSKNLKAIAVRAGNAKITFYDPDTFHATVRSSAKILAGDISTLALRAAGTGTGIDLAGMYGNAPAKYWTQGAFDVATISANTLVEKFPPKHAACHACLVACGKKLAVLGDSKGLPEYETLLSFGSLALNDDALSLIDISAQCDALGIDTITAGSVIAFAAYLREQGIVPPPAADFDFRWSDGAATLKLIEMITRREGIGNLLAEGTRAFGANYGAAHLAVQVNGLELAMHDPRALSGMALAYATSPIGGSHNHPDYYWLDQFSRPIEALGIVCIDRFGTHGKAANLVRFQDWRAVGSSLVQCSLPNPDATSTVTMLAAATGYPITLDNVLTYGERMMNLKRALNLKLGYHARATEKMPALILRPLAEGATEGHVPALEPMLREYYAHRDWDWGTGKPRRKKLLSLGMSEIANDLWG